MGETEHHPRQSIGYERSQQREHHPLRRIRPQLGIPFHEIGESLAALFGDARYWLDHQTYSPDEIAIRFYHRLVLIHPFPNGSLDLCVFVNAFPSGHPDDSPSELNSSP
jgi:hypothetical protein